VVVPRTGLKFRTEERDMTTLCRAAGLMFALAVPLTAPAPAVAAVDTSYSATVVHVIDGDSLTVQIDGEDSPVEVRLIGVDAPSGGCASRESTAFATDRLADESVRLRIDRKRDETDTRLFAYVYVHGDLFNLASIRAGYSRVRTYGEFGVDQLFKARFQSAQQQAEDSDRGLWDDGAFPVCG
jgi:endonuclease YncB( thermonuclease family)